MFAALRAVAAILWELAERLLEVLQRSDNEVVKRETSRVTQESASLQRRIDGAKEKLHANQVEADQLDAEYAVLLQHLGAGPKPGRAEVQHPVGMPSSDQRTNKGGSK